VKTLIVEMLQAARPKGEWCLHRSMMKRWSSKLHLIL